jgi:transmembrane sensor
MSSIHRLPDVAVAERKASEWVARLHADDVTSEDLARFEAWRAAHPRHARAYEEISATLNEVKLAGHIVRAVSFGNAMNAASDPSQSGSGNSGAASSSYRLRIAAAAAIVMVAVTTAWWLVRSEQVRVRCTSYSR